MSIVEWAETRGRELGITLVWQNDQKIGYHLEDRWGKRVDVHGRPLEVGGDGRLAHVPPERVMTPRECGGCGEEFFLIGRTRRTAATRARCARIGGDGASE